MLAFLGSYWIELIFGLLSVGIIAYAKRLNSKFKHYQALIAEQQEQDQEEKFQDLIKPFAKEHEDIDAKFELVIGYFRYMIIDRCKNYLERGYLSANEFEKLSEEWKLYSGLGGNHQVKDYYEKVCDLPIRN